MQQATMEHASMYDRAAQEDSKAGWDNLQVPSLRLYAPQSLG